MSNARIPLALSILLVAACGDAGTSPTTDADAGTDATTAGCASEGDSSTTDADASTSAGSSSTSDASSGEGSGGGDGSSTSEPAPVPTACFGTPCTDSAECLPGLRCMTRPETGEGMCVTTCVTTVPICDVEAVSCGAFIPKVAPVECIDGGCFPAVCDVLADCPAGSVACDAGLCY